jgi:DNA ligase-1
MVAFQETITRKRLHGVAGKAAELPVRFFVFDVLFLNGQELVERPLLERKGILNELLGGGTAYSLSQNNSTFVITPYIQTASADEIHAFHTAQLAAGLEGAVMKQVSAPYQPGRKGWSWVKIKEEEGTRGKLADTMDLIVMGYYSGRGKRLELGLGAFLVGLRDPNSDQIRSISKIGTGLTDDQFREMKRRCQPLEVATKPALYDVNRVLAPDVWVEPAMVVEIAADEITSSTLHTSGVSLRFPRLIKWRDDKNIDEATTLAELRDLSL